MATITCDTTSQSISIKKHRCYEEMEPRWSVIQDTIQDEFQIKSKGVEYLPMPSGIAAQKDTTLRTRQYNAYKQRAIYYAYLSQTIGGMMGLVTRKPAQIKLPDNLEDIKTSTGFDGDSLLIIMNRTLENQLSYSRYGILLDIRDGAEGSDVIPFMSEYLGDKIINWEFDIINGKSQLVSLVLDESFYQSENGFKENHVENYRICALDYVDKEPVYYTYTTSPDDVNDFVKGQGIPEINTLKIPNILNKTLSFIPFQPFNALSLEMKTEIPILMQLADMSIAIYRGEADYRSSLFMQGQATPYGIGVKEEDGISLGANTFIYAPADTELGFLEVSGEGISSQKEGLDGLHKRSSEVGISLISGNSQESGEALNIRVGIKTASLTGVAKTNGKGFENLLKWSAEWIGLNQDDVEVIQNTDYSDDRPQMKEIVEFAGLVKTGQARAEDLYDLMVKFELTTSTDFATWQDEIQSSPFSFQEFNIGDAETAGSQNE